MSCDEDPFVYRIISVDRLYELFTTRENVLVPPSRWDDPFENFILKSRARLRDGTIVEFGFNNDFYGQCWTLKQASDAMWRIYSPRSDGVRIRTTVRNLLNSLSHELGEWAHVQAFIGKVRYLSDRQLRKFGNSVFEDGLNPISIAETLLVKRRAFDHEKEVRLLYFEKTSSDGRMHDLYRYKVDPHALIDQIMIDPRLDKNEAEELKHTIRNKTGFTGDILRSLLYAPPEGMIFPIGG